MQYQNTTLNFISNNNIIINYDNGDAGTSGCLRNLENNLNSLGSQSSLQLLKGANDNLVNSSNHDNSNYISNSNNNDATTECCVDEMKKIIKLTNVNN